MSNYLDETGLSYFWGKVKEAVYPVGSIYITVSDTSPASMLGGTWQKLSAGYALWTASSGAGNTISAGLPSLPEIQAVGDHTHDIHATGISCSFTSNSAGYKNINNQSSGSGNTTYGGGAHTHSYASSDIYGSSQTVQPPAIKVYAWKKIAGNIPVISGGGSGGGDNN